MASRSREAIPTDDASNMSSSNPPIIGSSSSLVTASTRATSPTSQLSPQDAESVKLKLRIRELEDQLSKSTLKPSNIPLSPPNMNIEMTSSYAGGTFHVLCETGSTGQPQAIPRSITHKTRLFGQSHWEVNGVLLVRVHMLFSHQEFLG